MKDNELKTIIAKQQGELYALREDNQEFKRRLNDIRLSLICIGGPLNDNKLGYNPAQRKLFHDINDTIEGLDIE